MAGPMVSLVSGYRRLTACARICEAVWRKTCFPSSSAKDSSSTSASRQCAELAVHVRRQYGTTDESRGDCGIIYRQGRIKFHLCGSKIDSHGFLFSPCFRFGNIKTPESTALRQCSPGCMIQRSGVTAKGAPGLYHTRFHPKVSLVCGYRYSRRQAKSLLLSVRAVRDRRILREGSQQGNRVPFPSSLCAAIPVGLFRTGDAAHGGCPY